MALKFYASVRLDIRRIQAIKQGSDVVGNRTRVTVKKNKVAPPFKVAEFDIMYNEGISTTGDLIDLGVERGDHRQAGQLLQLRRFALGAGARKCQELSGRERRTSPDEIDAHLRESFGLVVNFEPKAKAMGQRIEAVDDTDDEIALIDSDANRRARHGDAA